MSNYKKSSLQINEKEVFSKSAIESRISIPSKAIISKDAFSNCGNLEKIEYKSKEETIQRRLFAETSINKMLMSFMINNHHRFNWILKMNLNYSHPVMMNQKKDYF